MFDRSGVDGHQSLARDHLAYCDLASEHQQRANDIFREMHALTVSRVERRNSSLSDALRQVPNVVVGDWVLLYITASTVRQGAKAGADAKVLKNKFALNWTGPYKIFAVGPCPFSDTPDGSPLGDKLLYVDLPTDMPGVDAHGRVSVERCKPWTNPHDRGDMPKYLRNGLTKYVLNNLTNPPPSLSRDSRRRVGAPPVAKGGNDDRPPLEQW